MNKPEELDGRELGLAFVSTFKGPPASCKSQPSPATQTDGFSSLHLIATSEVLGVLVTLILTLPLPLCLKLFLSFLQLGSHRILASPTILVCTFACVRGESLHLPCAYPHTQHNSWKRPPFRIALQCHFCYRSDDRVRGVCFWTLYPLGRLSSLVPAPHCLNYCSVIRNLLCTVLGTECLCCPRPVHMLKP